MGYSSGHQLIKKLGESKMPSAEPEESLSTQFHPFGGGVPWYIEKASLHTQDNKNGAIIEVGWWEATHFSYP